MERHGPNRKPRQNGRIFQRQEPGQPPRRHIGGRAALGSRPASWLNAAIKRRKSQSAQQRLPSGARTDTDGRQCPK